MNKIRKLIFQNMVKFIEESTMYSLEDISEIIQEPSERLQAILAGSVDLQNHHVELNLIRLYSIAVHLHHLYRF